MKNIILLTILFQLFAACDAPQTTRRNVDQNYNQQSQNYNPGTSEFSDGSGTNDNEEETDTGSTEVIGTTGVGYETCDLGIQYNGGAVGNFGICQNTANESKLKAIFANTDTSVGTCFVPVHISGAQSFKLGIAECVHNVANQEYSMTLNKQRAEPINGVMVIKASSLNSYMQCMNAKANYINSIPGCAYNQQCVSAATNYANQTCQSFISYHSSNYKQVKF